MKENKTGLEVKADTSSIAENRNADKVLINQTEDKRLLANEDSDKGHVKETGDNQTAEDRNNSDLPLEDKTVNTNTDNSNASDSNISVKDNTDTTDYSNKGNEDTEDSNRKLSNIEKYNLTLNSEEHKEQCRQAGIKSGEARRDRKTLGEQLKIILAQGDNQERLCMALFQSALKGNYKAFNSLRDTIGEMPTQKQEVTATITDADKELLEKVSARLDIKE